MIGLRRFWWVGVFCALALVTYSHVMKSRTAALAELQFRASEMQKEYLYAVVENDDLSMQIASQTDPAWVELVLLREMGVVPEGYLKVHFKSL
jgi:hypothetical protein